MTPRQVWQDRSEIVGHNSNQSLAGEFLVIVNNEYAAERPLVCKMRDQVPDSGPSEGEDLDRHVIVVRGASDRSGTLRISTLDPWDQDAGEYRFVDIKSKLDEIDLTDRGLR